MTPQTKLNFEALLKWMGWKPMKIPKSGLLDEGWWLFGPNGQIVGSQQQSPGDAWRRGVEGLKCDANFLAEVRRRMSRKQGQEYVRQLFAHLPPCHTYETVWKAFNAPLETHLQAMVKVLGVEVETV